MSVNDLIETLKSMDENGQDIDIKTTRERIYKEYEKATTIEDRVTLLKIFNAVMDLVERSGLSPDDLQEYRNAREDYYKLFIVQESLVGENVCPETLAAVTQREVTAGRMSPDNELYLIAQREAAGPHFSRAELVAIAAQKGTTPTFAAQPKSGWRRALGWMQR
jgi:hypothetical protein